MNEDCLYLNIWAPRTKGPHPVFVWIHGGGFVHGRASDPKFAGTRFASEQVVLITVEYRLGVFGFLDMSSLLGSSYAGSANNGTRDVIQALQWIHENIEAFGGDPDRVTIGGESAGAKMTDLLLCAAEAQPLFLNAISESGGADRVYDVAASLEVSEGFGKIYVRHTGEQPLRIQSAPAAELIALQSEFLQQWPAHFPLRPQMDGSLLPHDPLGGITRAATGKRLLIGTNRDESAAFIGPHPATDPKASDLSNMSLATFEKIFRKYGAVYPGMSTEQLRIRAVTAEEYWIPSVRVADAFADGGGEVWMYRFDYMKRSGHLRGTAAHAAETPLVWSRPESSKEDAAAEAVLAHEMHTAWLSFVNGATPSATGLPRWELYTSKDRLTMVLDVQSCMEKAPQNAERQLWDGLLNDD